MKYRKHFTKRKGFALKAKSSDWKPVAIDEAIISNAEFDSFGGLEELTNYEVIRSSDIDKMEKLSVVEAKDIKKKSKIKKKRKKIAEDPKEISEDFGEAAVAFKDPVKRKKRKLSKKKKKLLEMEKNEVANSQEVLENDEQENSTSINETDNSFWSQYYLPEPILLALKDLGFQKPTPIQELTLEPAIRDHLDILGAAETGSGKTLAFGIPIVTHILNTKERETDKDGLRPLKALVLTPTRELAVQVKNHLLMLLKYTDIKIAVVIGGLASEKQERILKKCPDIVVATPGRLWELMEEGNSHLSNVPNVRYLVVDEADRMVEKGHFAELTQILDLINSNKEDKRRQTFIFSATLTAIHELPRRMIMKKRKIKHEKKHKIDSLAKLIGMKENARIIDITNRAGVAETLSESKILCSTEEKDLYIYYFISMYPGRTLVFCNSISSVRRLKNVLELLECHPLPLHASMQQRQRLKNVERFAEMDNSLLLATDVAARGLDIKGIEHVIHYQVPRTTEVYIHRSGRTARAQNEGLSLMIVGSEESMHYHRICKSLNQDQPLSTFPVDNNIFKMLKQRVQLSREIDLQEHRTQRLAAQNRWFTKAAEEMEVDIDDEQLLNDLGDDRKQSQNAKKIKSMRKQLKNMLQKRIVPKAFTGRYPTKSGKLVKVPIWGSEKACDVMKRKH